MTGEHEKDSYTGTLQSVYHTLGRIDGKLDSFDSRIRLLEERESGRAAVERLERESLDNLKNEVISLKRLVENLNNQDLVRDAVRKYWYVLILAILPVIFNTIQTIQLVWPPSP